MRHFLSYSLLVWLSMYIICSNEPQRSNTLIRSLQHIYIYSFSRCFYPKRLTIVEYNKRYIIKKQTVTGVLVIQRFSHCSEQKLARQGEVKEREQRCFFLEEEEVK